MVDGAQCDALDENLYWTADRYAPDKIDWNAASEAVDAQTDGVCNKNARLGLSAIVSFIVGLYDASGPHHKEGDRTIGGDVYLGFEDLGISYTCDE